ncbi:MAG: nucleotidyltransferase domain-containing protein [Bacteroidales bacterium]|nr:nucleotidyltransferase domain-containing protein [Bacteroidales bacterium]
MDFNIIKIISDYFKSQPVLKAWLFGSFSRGEQTEKSDVDILVEFDKDAKVSLLDHATMVCDLQDLLHRDVDLVKEGTLKPFAVPSANKDKILIYERGN